MIQQPAKRQRRTVNILKYERPETIGNSPPVGEGAADGADLEAMVSLQSCDENPSETENQTKVPQPGVPYNRAEKLKASSMRATVNAAKTPIIEMVGSG